MSVPPEGPPSAARRRLLSWVATASGVGAAVLTAGPALRAFLFPAFKRPPPTQWFKLGELGGFSLGVPTRVEFPDVVADAWVETRVVRSVWVYTDDGARFRAYNAHCTHLGCAYGFDAAPDPPFHRQPNVFHCPGHHGIFDPKTGRVLAGPPPRPLDALETKVMGGSLYVAYQDFRVGIPEKVAV